MLDALAANGLRRPSSSRHTALTAAATGALICSVLLFLNYSAHVFRKPRHYDISSPSLGVVQAWRRDLSEYVLDHTEWDVQAPPARRSYNWTISEVWGNPDGVRRKIITVDGQFPGPLVRCNEGDTIVVDVHNAGENSTSIHWHGMSQDGSNWMDGITGVTNCAIPPGGSFRYEFTVRNQSGTYWYHAHTSTQRIDGVFGPLIVHSKDEAIGEDYHTDQVVMVQDWYYDLSAGLLRKYLAPDNENSEPIPKSGLINGRNVVNCELVEEGYSCDNSTNELAFLQLAYDKTHRLRFINVGAFTELELDIDEHSVSLIEVDSVPVTPSTIHRFRINVAQRYSVLLRLNSPEHYYLRARMLPHCFAEIPDNLDTEVRAIISPSSLRVLPSSTPWNEQTVLECTDLNLTLVSPASPRPLPLAELRISLDINFEIGSYRLARGFVNSTTWRPSRTGPPTLLDAIDHASLLSEGPNINPFPNTTNQLIYALHKPTTVDLLISNFDDGNHPVHLHGHEFRVLGHGLGYYEPGTSKLELENPIGRDTVTVEAYGWVMVRVQMRTGVWALHCHTAWHLEAGMLMTFLVGQEEVRKWKVPEEVRECDVGRQRWMGVRDEEFYWE